MARIELLGLAHSYQAQPRSEDDFALKRFDHVWQDGDAYALLGPSGCGKTTLLNLISGLLPPTQGQIHFDGHDVTGFSPERRNIAQVFQFPVIYDTMTVEQNLAFPLRNRKVPEPRVRERVQEVAELLELTPDLKKRARGLTADAKQKISLGRGLVRSEDVAAILFDEPLTVIDPHLKWRLRRTLKQIHARFQLTLVYVTHDQNEALTFADHVVVMNDGRVLQVGTPRELFEEPSHTFVGYFIGSPGMNLLPCQVESGAALIDGARVALPADVPERARRLGGRLEIGVRPEFLKLDDRGGDGRVEVDVVGVEHLGNFQIATVALGGRLIKVKLSEQQAVPADKGFLTFTPQTTKLYADGQLVRSTEGAP